MTFKNVDEGFQGLRIEFADQCRVVTDELESLLNQVYDGKYDTSTAIQLMRREMHNLKGQGSVFGYPVISMIAHRLEDYLAKENALEITNINEVNIYLDHIRGIINSAKLPTEAETTELLRSLPQSGFSNHSDVEIEAISEEVEIMAVTSSKLHRHRLESAVTKPGWRLISFNSTLNLLENALASPPNGVIVSGELPSISGIELATVFQALPKLKNVPFAILTSRSKTDSHFKDLPNTVEYISTGQGFSGDVQRMIEAFSPQANAVLPTKNTQPVSSKPSPKQLEVLFAEDNRINQILVQRFLDEHPFNVTLVENGVDAVDACKNKKFDIVLMDVMMPKMGGVEAAETIRKLNKPWAKDMPIIALTADYSAEHQKKYKKAGMNDCIGKPIEPDSLTRMINDLTQ
ncbi:response regulator [Kiloniella majae]|uniref:response regulator n=1 Tax=Kiloniella majae TaxID=1938558 RepID=UPI000A278DD0|nr:response regulator [Kiloniella majae]